LLCLKARDVTSNRRGMSASSVGTAMKWCAMLAGATGNVIVGEAGQ
jgi:hypothetical protein